MNRTLSAFAALAFGATAFVGAAKAQTTLVEVADATVLMPWNLSAKVVDDMHIMGAGGQRIGKVDGVVGSNLATPTALVVDFDDRAGFGDRDNVVIPVGNFTPANDMLTLNSDAAAVGAMSTWND